VEQKFNSSLKDLAKEINDVKNVVNLNCDDNLVSAVSPIEAHRDCDNKRNGSKTKFNNSLKDLAKEIHAVNSSLLFETNHMVKIKSHTDERDGHNTLFHANKEEICDISSARKSSLNSLKKKDKSK
jgi:predicted regulator of Ras-like GTPase activity (Roadblock/LC7/MglB family)